MKLNRWYLILVILGLLAIITGCARYKVESTIPETGLPGESIIEENVSEETEETVGEETPSEETTEEVKETPTSTEEEEEEEVKEEVTESPTEELEEETKETPTPEETKVKETPSEEETKEETTTAPSEGGEEVAKVFTYTEGDLVDISKHIKVYDEDKDKLTIKYGEPLDENGKWQTKEGDAGTYETYISVSDGKTVTRKKIMIKILPLNHPPVISGLEKEIRVKEGDLVELEPEVSDPDGDKVTVSFEGWINSSKYQTTYDDAGEHIVKVIASDGKATTEFEVKIIVEDVNRAPVLIIK